MIDICHPPPPEIAGTITRARHDVVLMSPSDFSATP